MKKTFKLMTVSALLIMCGCQSKPAETSGTYTPGEYSAAADGFGSTVKPRIYAAFFFFS